MALTTCEVSPVVLQGANVGLQICGTDVPVDKIDLKIHTKKTEVTSTASNSGGTIWEEYAPGSSGGTVSWDGHWRVSQIVRPPDLITGKIYPAKAFARKAGTNGATDPGLFYSFNIFVDDSSLTLDPKSGVITWKVSTTVTGAITYPSGS
jgi:hypothetical protein